MCPSVTEDGGQGHLGVGTLFRVSPTADFAADHEVAQAEFGCIIVQWHLESNHEDEEFLDVVLHDPSQLGLGS